MILACYMCNDPRLFDGRTLFLLALFGLLAYTLSPACQWLRPRVQNQVALLLPPAILLYWFVFQRELLLTDPMSRGFYRSMWGQTAWRLNSGICIAFGIAFSLRIVRTARKQGRMYGILGLLAFVALLLGFNSIGPVSSNSGLRYRIEAWMHPPVTEPSFGGKALSYWARRADGLADESEPALNAIRSMGPEGVNALIRAFRTGEGSWTLGEERRPHPWDVRRHAADALIKLGPASAPAVPLMVKSLQNPDRTIREQAAKVLGAVGDASQQVVNALIQSLGDEDADYHAMKSLARLAEKDPAIVQQLAATAKGPKAKAAYWAMVSLSEIGDAARPVLADLIECVKRGPSDSRQPAVQAIALIGTNAVEAVPVLTTALRDSDEWTRKCIYIALGRIGPRASNAVPILRTALTNEPYLPARTDISRALWRIDGGQIDLVLAAIKRSLDQGDNQLQNEGGLPYDFLSALDLIGEMGPEAALFVPRLRQHLASGDSSIQFNAAWALWQVSPDQGNAAETVLRRLVGLEDYPLERIGFDDWGRGLSDLKRKRESFHLRIAVIGALWQKSEIAGPELIAMLVDLLRDWDYFYPMKGVIPEERAVVPALTAILADPSQAKVHPAARAALRAISGNAGERW